jgi:HAD superfamily hydrolase (TIGR01549 family)
MKIKEYDAYLFDWDGTVAQTLSTWMPIVRNTLASYDIQVTDKQIVRTVFGTARDGMLRLGVPEADLPKIFASWDKTAAANLPHVPFYDGITDVFAALKRRGKKLAVVTATIRPTMEVVFDSHSMHDMFDVVVTGSDIKAHKPDPEGVLFALGHLGVDKDRAVMLGDSEKDLGAARNAGIDSVLFYPPQHELFHALEELKADEPTYVIHSWQELSDQLQ